MSTSPAPSPTLVVRVVKKSIWPRPLTFDAAAISSPLALSITLSQTSLRAAFQARRGRLNSGDRLVSENSFKGSSPKLMPPSLLVSKTTLPASLR